MPLNKKQILALLKSNFNYDKSQFYISFKAALVLYGIYETTNDIDIAITSNLSKSLINNGYKINKNDYGKQIKICDEIECYDEGEIITKNLIIIEGYQVEVIEDIRKRYLKMNRDKDQATIRKIDNYLSKENSKKL